jgi:hypothetical protein
MNETVSQTDSSLRKNSVAKLPEPHFNDNTIATAQPVEPIVPVIVPVNGTRRSLTIGTLIRYLSTKVAVVFAVTMVSIAGVALVSASFYQRPRAEAGAAIKPVETQTQSGPAASTATQDNSVPRARPRTIRPVVSTDDSKPAARRVGVITYGRSSQDR